MRVREMQSDDYEAVQKVRSENGLGCLSRAEWDHFEHNPHRTAGRELPIGWVLENNEGRIVGIHGVYPVRYRWKERSLLAGVAHTLAVAAEHRLSTAALMAPFFRLETVDFVLSTSANQAAATYFEFMKARRMPVAHFTAVLSWVVNCRRVAAAALQKRQMPWPWGLSFPAAAAVRLMHAVCRRNRLGRISANVRVLDGFDERFDRFWQQLAARSRRLLAVRDRASLQWHFEFALRKNRVRILALEDGNELVGYAVLLREIRQARQLLNHYHLIDLQVLTPRAEAVEALIGRAVRVAQSEGMDMLDTWGFDQPKRRILEDMRPYVRHLDHWPFWYKVCRPIDGLNLDSPDVWDPTGLDGDATIWSWAC